MHNTNQKHLSLEDRNYIEQALNQNLSFKDISKFLSKDPTTISKEVKKHRIRKEATSFNTNFNQCINRYHCSKKYVCGYLFCKKKCSNCISCNKFCSEFEEELCLSLKQPPKVLLTFLFRNSKLMLAFLMKDKTSDTVIKNFDYLESILGNDLFEKTFPVILTDNGSEFSNPLRLEFNQEGIGRTRIFFCNPGASYQKGALEKNHEFIRYVIPKGISMNDYSQKDIEKMINHINSLTRRSLNGNTPLDLANLLLDKKVLKKLNLFKVPASEVKLTKNLLKKN